MRLPRRLARFNKKVTNPIQSLWAGRVAPWIILVHTGRTSGRSYRTPLLAWKRGDRLMISILYGEQSHWVRNVLAAHGAEVVRRGKGYRLRDARLVTTAGRRELSAVGRLYGRASGTALVADLVPAAPWFR
jgi:deazaflavin-dependent oxidoreductase (nitroreductase family)